MSTNAKKEKFIQEDHKGNYDIDGVSFDGKDVIVGGEKPESYKKRKLTKLSPLFYFALFLAITILFGVFSGLLGITLFDNTPLDTPTQNNVDLIEENRP